MAGEDFLARLGVAHPIVQAPLGGVPSDELVAAVSNAGGLGSLGAPYLTPDQIAESIRRIRALTDRPFAVGLFAGGRDADVTGDATRILELLARVHEDLGLPPPEVPQLPADPLPGQLEVVLDLRPAVLVVTFGIPDARSLARVRGRGIAIWGTATTSHEARLLAAAGLDAIVAQGQEAGGHRSTFASSPEEAAISTRDLVAAIAREVEVPIVAAGGLMDGRDVADVLRRGAVAGSLGTAFLATPDCGAPPAYKSAILAARGDVTALTRAFSGKTARGIRNAFIDLVARHEDAILPFPLQNALTRPMRAAAAKQGRAEYLSLWAGQGVARARALPAAELVATLMEELRAAGRGSG